MARSNRSRISQPAPARRANWLIAGLAVAGMLVSGYLSWLKLSGGGAAFCVDGSGCDIVQASRYALFLGAPTALWGFAVYAVIGALAVIGLSGRNWLIAFLLAAGGVGFSIYLTALSMFDLRATCVWCLTSVAIMIALLAGLLKWRPSLEGRKPRLSLARLGTYGGLAAIGAVVGGAFVFAAPSSLPAGYQSALARHLAETKAVMYGAFW